MSAGILYITSAAIQPTIRREEKSLLERERKKKDLATNCTRAQSKTEHGPVTDNVVRKEVPQMSNHRVHVKHYLYLTYLPLDTLKSSYRAVEQYSESIRRLLPCRNIWSHAQRSLC